MAAEILPHAAGCFHCGLPIPPGVRIEATVAGAARPMCCIGCRAVAEMLDAQGLAAWYQRRAEAPGQPAAAIPEVRDRLGYLDVESIERELVERRDGQGGEIERAALLVEGLRCAACVWVIEHHLGGLAGVQRVRVGLESHRVEVEWDRARVSLRDVLLRLAEIGFEARPDRPGERARLEREEDRRTLIRLGVAGLAAMNVMTYSVALWIGAVEGMTTGYTAFMRWMGLVVSTPVVLYSARPFFEGAWRDLRVRAPGMDVPVALAIGGAWLVSVHATLRGTGEVYFDSVCMFTFFLTLGRYLELRVRHRAAETTRSLADARPLVARRLEGEGEAASERIVPATALAVGDRFRVRPGESIGADGRVVEGRSAVEEALLTGEPWPRGVEVGSTVIAGSINVDSPLLVEATRVGAETTLASIVALVERAAADRPPIARFADRVAVWFVSAVLAVAFGNWLAWQSIDPSRALWTTLAVLVATCPCALGLATPAALAAATRALAAEGLLVSGARVLEGLASVGRFVFDKTGTLTRGAPRLACIEPLAASGVEEVLAIARRLERDSEHPIARALVAGVASPAPGPWAHAPGEIEARPGCGIEGRLAGRRFRIGRPDWALAASADEGEADAASSVRKAPAAPAGLADDLAAGLIWVLLADDSGALAWIGVADPLRAGVEEALAALRERGLALEMLSGDASPSVEALARRLDLALERPGCRPEEKVARVRALQRAGERVAVVGDGVNDGPFLGAGDVSIAMGSGCDLSRLGADAVLLRDDLGLLPRAVDHARRTRRIMRQNFAWAIAYNVVALPLATTGHLSPWLAAIGMSASSLVVVLNALRLRRLAGEPRVEALQAASTGPRVGLAWPRAEERP